MLSSSEGPETPLPYPETLGNLLVPPQKVFNLVSTLHSLQSRENLSKVPGARSTPHQVVQRFPILGKLLLTPEAA